MLYKNNPNFKNKNIRLYNIVPTENTVVEFNKSDYFMDNMLNVGYCINAHCYGYNVNKNGDPLIINDFCNFKFIDCGNNLQKYAEFRRFLGDKKYSDEKFDHYVKWFDYIPKTEYPSTQTIITDILSSYICNDIYTYYLTKKSMTSVEYKKYYTSPTISMMNEETTTIDDIMKRTYLKSDNNRVFDGKEFILLRSTDSLFTIVIYKKRGYGEFPYDVYVFLDDKEQRELELECYNNASIDTLKNLVDVLLITKRNDSYLFPFNGIDSLKKSGTLVYVDDMDAQTREIYITSIDETHNTIIQKYISLENFDNVKHNDDTTILN